MPRKKVPGPPAPRSRGSAHKGQKLQQWPEAVIDKAVALCWAAYESTGDWKKANVSKIARDNGLPPATLWKRVHGKVKGKGHRSGGKRNPKVLSEGKSTEKSLS